MSEKKYIAVINKKKYLEAPSWHKIEEFIAELGVSYHHFERFYGLSYHTLTQVKAGTRRLPSRYWHFIYEKIKPTYGSGFYENNTIPNIVTNSVTNSIPKAIPTYRVATKPSNVAYQPDNPTNVANEHDRSELLK